MIKYSIKDLHRCYQVVCFSFSSQDNKSYRPLMPLTQQYNTIYTSPQFEKNALKSSSFNFLYYLPAGLMTINNFLTDWSLIKTAAFSALLIGGALTKAAIHTLFSLNVGSVQIDQNIQNLYVTLYKSPFTMEIQKQVGNLSELQEARLMSYYHPIVETNPNQIQAKTKQQFIAQHLKNPQLKNLLKFQKKVMRVKLPLSLLKFSLIPSPTYKPTELERDLERLGARQLLKKYEKSEIQFSLKNNLHSQVLLRISPQNNTNKKYQDYLICLGMGLRVDTSANAAKDDQKNN